MLSEVLVKLWGNSRTSFLTEYKRPSGRHVRAAEHTVPLGRLIGSFEYIWLSFGLGTGPKGDFGTTWATFGTIWAAFGTSWAGFETSWPDFGTSLANFGARELSGAPPQACARN